jgi:hypothetical protein
VCVGNELSIYSGKDSVQYKDLQVPCITAQKVFKEDSYYLLYKIEKAAWV